MDLGNRSAIRDFIIQRLQMRGDLAPLEDGEPLFTSGRLDSLDAVEMVMFIEGYGADFSAINFDLTLIDSVDTASDLICQHQAGA